MSSFKQSGSSKFQGYMIQMIKKIHDAEEMLLSGDDRHLEDLKEISDMIDEYVNEAQGQKFEPMQYRQMQGNPRGTQSFFDYPEYPEMERGRDTRGHIGYIPYYPPHIYPFFNQGQGGGGQGGSSGGSGGSGGGSGGSQNRGGQGGGSRNEGYSNERGNRRG